VGDHLGHFPPLPACAAIAQATERARLGPLEHELADVLWSVIVIADRCGIDLETAFARTMDELGERLGSPP